MTRVITGRNVNAVYDDALAYLRIAGVERPSRNGPVIKAPEPVISEYLNPRERVLWCPKRDANPVFHLIEALWMLSGSNDVTPLVELNPRMREYAEDDGYLHGAYGFRWRRHFASDQLWQCVVLLREAPETRRVVLTVWDPGEDLGANKKDLPCNTQIYFSVGVSGALEMTVTCRSNDAIWGAYGANVVHMSVLHEWMALAAGLPLGTYRQFSNDFHVYKNMPRFEEIWNTHPDSEKDQYVWGEAFSIPLFENNSLVEAGGFLDDCEDMFSIKRPVYRTQFMACVAGPLHAAFLARKAGREWEPHLNAVPDCDWKLAFIKWTERRKV